MKPGVKFDSNLVKRYSFYLFVGVVFILGACMLFFAFPPQINQLVANWQNLTATTKEVARLTEISAALTTQDATAIRPYLNRATFALPDEKKTAGLVSGLTSFANTYGVAIQTLDFSPGLISTRSASTGFLKTNEAGEVDVLSGVKAVPATLTATSDPTSLKNFLVALRQASQIIGVTLVDYSTSDKNLGSSSISVLIYYQPKSTVDVDWKNIKTLTADDITFLGTLPNVDQFTLK